MQEAQPRCLLAPIVEPAWVAYARRLWAWKLDQGCRWGGDSGPELPDCPFSVPVEIQEFRGWGWGRGWKDNVYGNHTERERVRVSSLSRGFYLYLPNGPAWGGGLDVLETILTQLARLIRCRAGGALASLPASQLAVSQLLPVSWCSHARHFLWMLSPWLSDPPSSHKASAFLQTVPFWSY